MFQHETVNFALTNRIPRRLLTVFVGWFSRIEHPLVCNASLAVWRLFGGNLDLREAKERRFRSLHHCFVRELKDGARPIDLRPDIATSPCDAIVGACGRIEGTTLLQAKDSTYTLEELVGDRDLASTYHDGWFVTLRLASTMYHRFHAPFDSELDHLTYIAGDVWNVNPPALRRVRRLFCQNERAVLPLRLVGTDHGIMLVPVAAILVASIQFKFAASGLDLAFHGCERRPCRASFAKGEEMGHFRHGSTILAFASRDALLCANVQPGTIIRVGQPLFELRRQPA